ncbi:MAG TPA: hypothetical protein PLV92_07570, partial [Pirellulaceae bacterium]|nr:hypothetical protein [Pirellulaceae bacterium]
VAAGNTYFENEKRTYGLLMAQVLGGREGAIKDLQVEDGQAKEWHRETQGIDFYACFTIKHQTRKFFYFGDLLEPAYRQRMIDGAKAWTAQDPLKRPHYAFDKPGEGWGPNVRNSWVDVRSTENLYLMRVTSVYLFAEATGNRDVAAKYKNEIRRYATTLFRVGMGEWDSENYHGHSIAPLCNLYDFAQDPEVKLLAKACLDWAFAAGAVKYNRGGFNGPTKRDYNHSQPFGGSAANMLWVAFGDSPRDNAHWESDEVHLISSAYRPPPAVIELARKNFTRPVELYSSKPIYSATTGGDAKSAPEFLETQYFGATYQLGSLSSGTSEDGGDVNGLKLLVRSKANGAVALQGVPGPDPQFVGSPQYQRGKVAGPNRAAQYENLAVWLVKSGSAPWTWVVPNEARATQQGDVTFLEFDETWVALRPLGAAALKRDDQLTRQIADGEKARFPAHYALSTRGASESYCGVAIEVGDARSHKSFDEFKRRASAARVDLAKLDEGIVQFKAADGKWLGFHWNDNPLDLGIWRNGRRHDWSWHAGQLYGVAPPPDAAARNAKALGAAAPSPTAPNAAAPNAAASNAAVSNATAPNAAAPIESLRGSGLLKVVAGGKRFECQVAEDGRVEFRNESAP